MTAALEVGEWSAARPGRTLPPGKTRYPLYRRLDRPQGRSGQAESLVPHRDSIPDRPASISVAIPTELPILSYYPTKIRYYRRYSDSLQAGRSGDRIPFVPRFSVPVLSGPGAHPDCYTMSTGSFQSVKRPGRGVDHPPHLAPRLRKEYIPQIPLLGLRGLFQGDLYLYSFTNFSFIFM